MSVLCAEIDFQHTVPSMCPGKIAKMMDWKSLDATATSSLSISHFHSTPAIAAEVCTLRFPTDVNSASAIVIGMTSWGIESDHPTPVAYVATSTMYREDQ
jgi:hypothetical protein